MASTKVFIVTRRARSDKYSERVLKEVIPPRRSSVVLLVEEELGVGDPTKPINDVTQAAKNIANYIDEVDPDGDSYLLIEKDARASQKKLKARWAEKDREDDQIFVGSESQLLRKLEKYLKDLGFHWHTYAENQLKHFDGHSTPLDIWCKQFSDLGVGYLGRRLSMQLQLIGSEDRRRSFGPHRNDKFGQKILHCYFDDGDYGGSSIGIRDQLEHDFPKKMVGAIKVTAVGIDLPTDADEIVIYEDGLWSGRETVKRLKLIKESKPLQPIRFKFVVVTDFGVMVARQAIRSFGLQDTVSIDANNARFKSFLRADDVPSNLQHGRGMEPKAYFKALHEYVVQSAFRNPDDWPPEEGGVDIARNVAKELGSQLLRSSYKDHVNVEGKVKKFCLGAGGFASTMMFTRSVPKVCLPLFWLSGPVSLNGKSIEKWKPLFLDARRIDPSSISSD